MKAAEERKSQYENAAGRPSQLEFMTAGIVMVK